MRPLLYRPITHRTCNGNDENAWNLNGMNEINTSKLNCNKCAKNNEHEQVNALKTNCNKCKNNKNGDEDAIHNASQQSEEVSGTITNK